MHPFVRFTPVIIIMGGIFFLSHQPGDVFGPYAFDWADKIAHLLVYSLLCVSLIYSFSPQVRSRKRKTVIIVSLLVCLFYGISDEFHQSFIPGRFPSMSDIAADVAGGVLVSLLWFYFVKNEQTDQHPVRESSQ